jgi:hypothetical protein
MFESTLTSLFIGSIASLAPLWSSWTIGPSQPRYDCARSIALFELRSVVPGCSDSTLPNGPSWVFVR